MKESRQILHLVAVLTVALCNNATIVIIPQTLVLSPNIMSVLPRCFAWSYRCEPFEQNPKGPGERVGVEHRVPATVRLSSGSSLNMLGARPVAHAARVSES